SDSPASARGYALAMPCGLAWRSPWIRCTRAWAYVSRSTPPVRCIFSPRSRGEKKKQSLPCGEGVIIELRNGSRDVEADVTTRKGRDSQTGLPRTLGRRNRTAGLGSGLRNWDSQPISRQVRIAIAVPLGKKSKRFL